MLAEDGKWFRVSLRLCGDALCPASVESALGLRPGIVGLKGEPRRGRAGGLYAPYETNVWVYSHDAPEDMPFEDQLTGLFSLLGSKAAELKKLYEHSRKRSRTLSGKSASRLKPSVRFRML